MDSQTRAVLQNLLDNLKSDPSKLTREQLQDKVFMARLIIEALLNPKKSVE